MSYALKFDETPEYGLQKIAMDQTEKALAYLTDEDSEPAEAIHEARKCCKKVRGLLRLARPALPAYSQLNTDFRDTAAMLSAERDAKVVSNTLARLIHEYSDEFEEDAFLSVRESLRRQTGSVVDDEESVRRKMKETGRALEGCRHQIITWKLDSPGMKAWLEGMARTYQRGRKAFDNAYAEGSGEAFHEWRKRVKYHSYHMKLFRPVWPKVIKARYKQTTTLSDILGEDHDLHVLRQILSRFSEDDAKPEEIELLQCLARTKQNSLREQARPLGRRVFAETPKALMKRLAAYSS